MWWPRGWGAEFISSSFLCVCVVQVTTWGGRTRAQRLITCTDKQHLDPFIVERKKNTIKTLKKSCFSWTTDRKRQCWKEERKKRQPLEAESAFDCTRWFLIICTSKTIRLSDCNFKNSRAHKCFSAGNAIERLSVLTKRGSWITLPIFKRALWLQRWLVLVNDSLVRSINKTGF